VSLGDVLNHSPSSEEKILNCRYATFYPIIYLQSFCGLTAESRSGQLLDPAIKSLLLFAPILKSYIKDYPRGPVAIAFDDTKISKCGKKIDGASW
jgi:hypothetical protein